MTRDRYVPPLTAELLKAAFEGAAWTATPPDAEAAGGQAQGMDQVQVAAAAHAEASGTSSTRVRV